MGFVSGGALAVAVSAAGGLGLIGGGYADAEWLGRELAAAGNQRVGCGFITWALAQRPAVLDQALRRSPAAAGESERARYAAAAASGDVDTAVVFAGEGTDLIHRVEPAGIILEGVVREAEAALARRFI